MEGMGRGPLMGRTFVWSDSFSVGGPIPGLLVRQEHKKQTRFRCLSAVFSAHAIKIYMSGGYLKLSPLLSRRVPIGANSGGTFGDFPTNRSFIHYLQETL